MLYKLFTTYLIALTFSNIALAGCFIAQEGNHILENIGEHCSTRYAPCSTFKIALSLMGYDSGILIDESNPTWNPPISTKDDNWLENWHQQHNPKLWIQNSCVWYSQIITQKFGIDAFKAYVSHLGYGNQDVIKVWAMD